MAKRNGYHELTQRAVEKFFVTRKEHTCRSCGETFDIQDYELYKKHVHTRVCRPIKQKLPPQGDLFDGWNAPEK